MSRDAVRPPQFRARLAAALAALLCACSGPGMDEDTAQQVDAAVTATAQAVPAAAAAIADAAPAVESQASLADRTREILRPRCGSCHTTSSPQAIPKALAVYDLDRPDWGATLSRARIASFEKRIAGRTDLADDERAALGD